MENEEIKTVSKEKEEKIIIPLKWGSFPVSMNGVEAVITISGKDFTDGQKADISSECANTAIALVQKINKIIR